MNRLLSSLSRFSLVLFCSGRQVESMNVQWWRFSTPLFVLGGATYVWLGVTRDAKLAVALGIFMLAEAFGLCWRGVRWPQLKEGKGNA